MIFQDEASLEELVVPGLVDRDCSAVLLLVLFSFRRSWRGGGVRPQGSPPSPDEGR